jgi:hypothetical protein
MTEYWHIMVISSRELEFGIGFFPVPVPSSTGCRKQNPEKGKHLFFDE